MPVPDGTQMGGGKFMATMVGVSNVSKASVRFFQDELEDVPYTLEAWRGKEGINRISEHVVVIRCQRGNLDLGRMCFKPARIELDCRKGKGGVEVRTIRGMVCSASMKADAKQFLYTIHFVPRLWLLTQKYTCRVRQNMGAEQIVREILEEYGFPFEMRLMSRNRIRGYSVQYGESDLDFIIRLAEENDFYFFFDHCRDKLIFIDDSSKLEYCRPLGEFTWNPGSKLRTMPETVSSFESLWEPQDFSNLAAETSNRGEAASMSELVVLDSLVRSAEGGHRFRFTGFPAFSYNVDYKIIRMDHYYDGNGYRNRLFCIPASRPYQPPQERSRPFIPGLLPATVLGSPEGGHSNQQPFVDDFGRIKVIMHWGHLSRSGNERSILWVPFMRERGFSERLPCVGSEVFVAFIKGDPDFPMVIGGTGFKTQPFSTIEFPHEKKASLIHLYTQKDCMDLAGRYADLSMIKHRKTPGENKESVMEKNSSFTMLNYGEKIGIGESFMDEATFLSGNRSRSLKKREALSDLSNPLNRFTQNATVGCNRQQDAVEKDDALTIEGNRHRSIEKNDCLTIGGYKTVTVGGKITEVIKGDTHLTVLEGAYYHDVASNGANYHAKGDVAHHYDASYKIKAAEEIEISSEGAAVCLTAASEIKLQVGESSLLMKSDGGIELSGIYICISGGDSVDILGNSITSRAAADHNTLGAVVMSDGAAVNTVKGGLVVFDP